MNSRLTFTFILLASVLALFSDSTHALRISHIEVIRDWQVTNNVVSFTAYHRTWRIDIWLTDVVENNENYYHGRVQGDEGNTFASFTLFPNSQVSGMIMTHNETYLIESKPHPRGSGTDITIYKESNVLLDPHDELPGCQGAIGLPHAHGRDADSEQASEEHAERGDQMIRTITSYKVAVYVDQHWLTASNNPWASQANTVGLFNDVNLVYSAAGLHGFTFKYIGQLSNPGYTTTSDMLPWFSGRSSTLASFRDTTYTNQLWLVGLNVGGLAYVGPSCNPSTPESSKTAVVGLVNYSRLYTVKTIAHELGHNRGSQHDFTNQCSSTLTTNCQCSVMSYCFPTASTPGGAVNRFSSTSINQMKTAGCY
jgi:hypothetical protein